MFIKSRNYDKCIQKVRIEVGTNVGLEKDEEAFIELKEIPTLEMMELKEAYEKGEKALMAFFKDLLPRIITDHNFYETEQKKMSPEALASLVFESLDLTQKVIGAYTNAAFFTRAQRSADKSHPSVPKSSVADSAQNSTENTGTGSAT
jgi:hypothetical protein